MEEQYYGQSCELRKTIEKLRTELNQTVEEDLNYNAIIDIDVIRISRLLDKLIVKCMECDIKECRYNRSFLDYKEGVAQ